MLFLTKVKVLIRGGVVFLGMKTRLEIYEKAINELHEAKMKLVGTTIKEKIIDLILIAGMSTAFVLGILVTAPFL